MSTLRGTTLNGRYRLEDRIGAGGMSTVYCATDQTLQRQVAIKLMHREIATDSDQLERFRREACPSPRPWPTRSRSRGP
jgi:serine/threonine-protein kinase